VKKISDVPSPQRKLGSRFTQVEAKRDASLRTHDGNGDSSVQFLLNQGRRRLEQQGIETAALDARLLLQRAAGLTHADLIANPDRSLAKPAIQTLQHMLERRHKHEPVSRILGEREFYGRRFAIDESVLDPRPETETLVEAALAALPSQGRILDLGTGSGAIITTLLAERQDTTGVAADRSAQTLSIARRNAERHGVLDRLELINGDWFQPVKGLFNLVVSNPPYIPTAEIARLAPEVQKFDPRLALDGGSEGLDAYRAISKGVATHLEPQGRLMLEIGAGQEQAVIAICQQAGLVHCQSALDLAGHVRCLVFTKS